MDGVKHNRRIRAKQKSLPIFALILLSFTWFLNNTYYFQVKIAGSILLLTGVLGFIFFVTAGVLILVWGVRLFKQEAWRNRGNYIVLGIVSLFFLCIFLNPRQLNENSFQDPVKIRYCYEGTVNTSHLYFRENGTFEDFNIGFFAHVHYYQGAWEQLGDTLYLHFEGGDHPKMLGEKLLMDGDFLYRIDADTLSNTHYYAGKCRGLN